MASDRVDELYSLLTGESEGRVCTDIPETACADAPRHFFIHAISLSATKAADGLIDPKLVLSWLLTHLGAPTAFVGLLVPIREAGALLPQLFTAASLRALPRRKWAWAAGSVVQGAMAALMALAALFLSGVAAGVAILAALTVLALARSVCSVTYKDVLGKTVAKSRRGTATGLASSAAAVAVIAFGLALTVAPVPRDVLVTGGLFLAGGLWISAALLFSTLQEEAGATEGGGNAFKEAKQHISFLRDDAQLRRFIITRGLLTSTALAPPFMVALAGRESEAGSAYGGLGLLVIASAGAALLSSYVWGRWSDRSSRQVLIACGIVGGASLAATVLARQLGWLSQPLVLPTLLFCLMIAYQGVRVGRSTHLVDMATQETRAAYTALSNTIIGVLLILGGLFSGLSAIAGEAAVLATMAGMSGLAAIAALGLEEVQRQGAEP